MISCVAIDGVWLDEQMDLFYEEGDTNLCNFEKLTDMIDCIFSLANKGVLHIAVYPEI